MYFLKDLEKLVEIPPESLGPNIEQLVFDKLKRDVLFTVSGRYGYIIAIRRIQTLTEGYIRPGTGNAVFKVVYTAILFKPFRGEVVDAQVTTTTMNGLFCSVGPCSLFLARKMIPPSFQWHQEETPSCYMTSEGTRLQSGSKIRIRILGVSCEQSALTAVASMNEPFLGIIKEEEDTGLIFDEND
ncbi:putative DNA-directed RNA polymerase II subunit rpb7 [Blattamonas nauphoetae]|uniref:DNA-directed RNA polymerase II subunit rpb7 n=1 Tax=Blattamonas nauphoetae TaxID=2049346 RepID=A0ABQ9YLZ8_9EUKA|nr:putative DNA-directed RNA polymerase II subunit rpb7 [Blattamonas nauphoetae]